MDDCGLAGIFGADANDTGTGSAGTACATITDSESAATPSGAGSAGRRAGSSPAKTHGPCDY
jgi:hypothetical protein